MRYPLQGLRLECYVTPGQPSDDLAAYGILDTLPEREFDSIARLAARLCGTPTALISLLDGDRQWFKAKVGFGLAQTSIEQSVCRYIVEAGDTVVIPDLAADERTSANSLITHDPGIRFYAGVPLTTRAGPLGALCVIDTSPRQTGLTADQQADLEALAVQVSALLEARRDERELKAALAARTIADQAAEQSERRWSELYRNMNQGFIYAQALRDDHGTICDWRYLDVNRAWGELSGLNPEEAIGRTALQMIPDLEDEWVAIASVADTHEPLRFTRQVGALGRWYDGTAQWVGGDHFTVLFNEVTDRVAADHRRDALLFLGDTLRDCDTVDGMVSQAVRIVGETLGASQALYGEMDPGREFVDVFAGWVQPGIPDMAGRHAMVDYGEVRHDMLSGRPLLIDDVQTDPRTCDNVGSWAAHQVRSVAITPVSDRERVVAVLVVHFPVPHQWTEDEVAFLRNAGERLEIGVARVRADARQALLNGELSHRMKNTMGVVQAIATQTLGQTADPATMTAFSDRLAALSRAHEVLLTENWTQAQLADVARQVLGTFGAGQRIIMSGPSIDLGSRAVLALSMTLHELATNATKYGALSVPDGKVTLTWTVGSGEDAAVCMRWEERGGPPAVEPTRRGFGSRVIRMGLVGSGGVKLVYGSQGLDAEMTAPLYQLKEA